MVGIGFCSGCDFTKEMATARSGKTFEKWKIILNLKETLTDPEMTKGRVMTHLEMRDYTLELSLRKIQEKHGRDMQ